MASRYLKGYAESFAIFAKYDARDSVEFDYGYVAVFLAEDVSAEDVTRLTELGWTQDERFPQRFHRDDRGQNDYS